MWSWPRIQSIRIRSEFLEALAAFFISSRGKNFVTVGALMTCFPPRKCKTTVTYRSTYMPSACLLTIGNVLHFVKCHCCQTARFWTLLCQCIAVLTTKERNRRLWSWTRGWYYSYYFWRFVAGLPGRSLWTWGSVQWSFFWWVLFVAFSEC